MGVAGVKSGAILPALAATASASERYVFEVVPVQPFLRAYPQIPCAILMQSGHDEVVEPLLDSQPCRGMESAGAALRPANAPDCNAKWIRGPAN